MSLRSTTAILTILVVTALIVVPGCGGGGGGGGPTPPANNAPQIQGFTAPDSAFPGSVVSITVNATDADGDTLSYTWSANGGTIDGSGATINWTAPVASTNYTITVTVTDGNGGQVQDSVTIAVESISPPPPPPL
jgi:hypothetical protein